MKKLNAIAVLLVALAVLSLPMQAQVSKTWQGGCAPADNVIPPGSTGFDMLNAIQYGAGTGTGWVRYDYTLGIYQGVTATSITTGSYTTLTGGTTIKIPAGVANCANAHVRIRGKGLYTTAAASILNLQVALCTVSGCGSGTVVQPAGCNMITANQPNILSNGQFAFECEFTTATTGTAGTLMAKSLIAVQLGAANSAAETVLQDATAVVSAAVDLTVNEFLAVQWKFTTANAGNSATLQQFTAELVN